MKENYLKKRECIVQRRKQKLNQRLKFHEPDNFFNTRFFYTSGIDGPYLHFKVGVVGFVKSLHKKMESPAKGDSLFDENRPGDSPLVL